MVIRTFRHGIVAAGMERMAAQQPPDSVVTALDTAVVFNGGNGVLGAAGIKTAMISHQRANKIAVTLYAARQ